MLWLDRTVMTHWWWSHHRLSIHLKYLLPFCKCFLNPYDTVEQIFWLVKLIQIHAWHTLKKKKKIFFHNFFKSLEWSFKCGSWVWTAGGSSSMSDHGSVKRGTFQLQTQTNVLLQWSSVCCTTNTGTTLYFSLRGYTVVVKCDIRLVSSVVSSGTDVKSEQWSQPKYKHKVKLTKNIYNAINTYSCYF